MIKKKIIIGKKSTDNNNLSSKKIIKKEIPPVIVDDVSDVDSNIDLSNNNIENELSDQEPQKIVIKSKRGRKPKIKTDEPVVKIPKKRGRKPKIKDTTVPEPKLPKKRGRKPKERTYSIVQKESETINTNNFENESYIICLKISSMEIESLFNNNNSLDTISPEKSPNTSMDLNNFYQNVDQKDDNNESEKDQKLIENLQAMDINSTFSNLTIPINFKMTMPKINPRVINFDLIKNIDKSPSLSTSNINIPNIFTNKNELWLNKRISEILPVFGKDQKEWPETSPYACWNCTEFFTTCPIGIPDRVENNNLDYINKDNLDNLTYYLYGNFCSFSCAARYLFDNEESDSLWEKYSYLNNLYSKVNNFEEIKKVPLAPKNVLLKKFGGGLNIEQYRNCNLVNKEFNIYKPPMIPILYQMEEITNEDLGGGILNKSTYIPLDRNKVKSAEHDLKLKRPTSLRKNIITIDKCMNMKVTDPVF